MSYLIKSKLSKCLYKLKKWTRVLNRLMLSIIGVSLALLKFINFNLWFSSYISSIFVSFLTVYLFWSLLFIDMLLLPVSLNVLFYLFLLHFSFNLKTSFYKSSKWAMLSSYFFWYSVSELSIPSILGSFLYGSICFLSV